MFRCQICEHLVPPRTRATRLIVDKRQRLYPARKEVHFVPDPEKKTKKKKRKKKNDPGGTGWEIAREVIACPAYASGSRV